MEIRGRAINLNANGGLDLVFVIDASSSVKKGTDFKSGLEFAKELVRTIGASKRYGPMTHCSQSVSQSCLLAEDSAASKVLSVRLRFSCLIKGASTASSLEHTDYSA